MASWMHVALEMVNIKAIEKLWDQKPRDVRQRNVFLINAWVRTKQRGKGLRDSLRPGFFLEVLTPRSML